MNIKHKESFVTEKEAQESDQLQDPLTEEEIISVTIGSADVLNTKIHLADYDPAWPLIFTQFEQEIRNRLREKVLLLEHVGSTSVPELAAKPIVDMVLAVSDSSAEFLYVPQLETLGYVLKIREPDWYEHRVLKQQNPQANLHVFSAGCAEIERMIVFREWLRHHPEARKRYESTKRKLAQQTWKYVQNYADAKSAVIQEIMNRACSRLG